MDTSIQIYDYQTGEVEVATFPAIENVRVAIAEAKAMFDIGRIRKIKTAAEVAETLFAAQGMEERAQEARAAALYAQRAAGELLKDMPKNEGGLLRGNTMLPRDNTPTLAELDISKIESSRWQALASIPEETFEEYIDEKLAKGYELTAGGLMKIAKNIRDGKPFVGFNTGENEWYTPPEYIAAARAVMGTIDLDPASSDAANKIVKAVRYFTKEDGGLEKDWRGKVWLNPPYSKDLIDQFIAKYAEAVQAGNVSEGIVLVNNATETAWFKVLASVSAAVVFPTGRVKFLDAEGNPGAPLQGQAVVYAGENPERFIAEFGKFGWASCIQA